MAMLSKHIFMLHRQLTIFMLQCYPKIIFCHYKMSFISKAKNLLVDETLQDVNDLMSLISNKRRTTEAIGWLSDFACGTS